MVEPICARCWDGYYCNGQMANLGRGVEGYALDFLDSEHPSSQWLEGFPLGLVLDTFLHSKLKSL